MCPCHYNNAFDAPVYQWFIPAGGSVYDDGLNVLDAKLLITRNFADMVDVFQLVAATKNSTFLRNIASPDYHTPAMSALYDGNIYLVNSYFAALNDM